MSSTNQSPIPLVVIGWRREIGVVSKPPLFKEHEPPYQMLAMDFAETLEPYRYSKQTLGAVLQNLHPRPRALVIGIAVDPSLVEEISAVWSEYVDTVLKMELKDNEEWKKNAISPLPLTHYVNPMTVKRPPKDMGWEKEMFRQLDAGFQA